MLLKVQELVLEKQGLLLKLETSWLGLVFLAVTQQEKMGRGCRHNKMQLHFWDTTASQQCSRVNTRASPQHGVSFNYVPEVT